MDLTNPAVTDGVDLFVNITIILIGFAVALSFVDFKKEKSKSN